MIKGVRGLWTLFATPTSIQTIYKEVIERAYIVLTYLTSIEGFVYKVYSIYNSFTVPMHCVFLVYAKHILLMARWIAVTPLIVLNYPEMPQ